MQLILTSRDLELTNTELNKIIYKPFCRFNDNRIILSHAAWVKVENKANITRQFDILVSSQIPNNHNSLFYEDKDFSNFFHPILRFTNNVVEIFNNARKIEAPSVRIAIAYIALGDLMRKEGLRIDI